MFGSLSCDESADIGKVLASMLAILQGTGGTSQEIRKSLRRPSSTPPDA